MVNGYPGIPLVACALRNGSTMVVLRAPLSVNTFQLYFECSKAQHCQTVGVATPRSSRCAVITESQAIAIISHPAIIEALRTCYERVWTAGGATEYIRNTAEPVEVHPKIRD